MLIIGSDSSIDGHFKPWPGSTLYLSDDVTISGFGELWWDGSQCPYPRPFIDGDEDTTLTLDTDITLHGWYEINIPLNNNGTVHADHFEYSLILGAYGNSGSGTWKASDAATLEVNGSVHGSADWEVSDPSSVIEINAFCSSPTGDVAISEGTFDMNSKFATTGEITLSSGRLRVDTTFTNAAFDLTQSGGTLDVNQNFETTGTLDMTGGKVEVSSGRTARFDDE